MAITGFTGIRLGAMQTIALSNSVATTITPPEGCDFILFECHQHNARIRFDGTAPTTTVGFQLAKDTPFQIEIGLDTTIKVIAIENSPDCYVQAFRVKRDNDA